MLSKPWLPAVVFLLVFAGHLGWLSRPAPKGCIEDAQGNSVKLASESAPVYCPSAMGFAQYIEGQDYYISFSYALAAAFTIYALRQWRRSRARSVAGAATGVTFAAAIAAFGCFVVGCCGSPMLPVWIAVFGARGVGLAKPIMAGVTVASLAISYLLMRRRCGDDCGCHAPAAPVATDPVTVTVAMADTDSPSPASAAALATVTRVAAGLKGMASVQLVRLDDPEMQRLGVSLEPTVLIDGLAVGVGQAPDADYLDRAIKFAFSKRCGCADGECCA